MHSSEKDAAEDKGYCHLPSSEPDKGRNGKSQCRFKPWNQSMVWWIPEVLSGMNLNCPLKLSPTPPFRVTDPDKLTNNLSEESTSRNGHATEGNISFKLLNSL